MNKNKKVAIVICEKGAGHPEGPSISIIGAFEDVKVAKDFAEKTLMGMEENQGREFYVYDWNDITYDWFMFTAITPGENLHHLNLYDVLQSDCVCLVVDTIKTDLRQRVLDIFKHRLPVG